MSVTYAVASMIVRVHRRAPGVYLVSWCGQGGVSPAGDALLIDARYAEHRWWELADVLFRPEPATQVPPAGPA